LGRKQWALDSSSKWEDKKLYELDVDAIAHKLSRGGRLDRRAYAALYQLLQWREKRVRQLNLPRRWVADDAVLLDLARVRPKDMEHLAAFRGLNKGELKNTGETILRALKAAPEEVQPMPAKPQRSEVPTTEEAQAIDLLRCFVSILADKHRISARHLLPPGPALELLRGKVKTKEDLIRSGILSDSAWNLVGDELLAFLHGKRALSVSDGVIQVINIP
jgi:ribonuclease D